MTSEYVTSIRKRTMTSTKPVQPGKHHHLSVLDRLMEKNHIRFIYYYPRTVKIQAGVFTKRLLESLSETLTFFPAIIGRLLKEEEGHWMIKCNDAGLRTVEARARGSVSDWLRNVDRDKELKLVYWEDMFHKPYYWSTFYVQLTEFEEGGFAIGMSCTHLLADPICATTFFKAWADTTLKRSMLTPPFFHPLPPRRPTKTAPNHKPYTSLINHYTSLIHKSSYIDQTSKTTTITFLFTDHMIQSCISMTRNPNASPFEALATLFWARLSKIKRPKGGFLDLSLCLNMRKVLGLDQGYFGNCMVYNKVDMKTNTTTTNDDVLLASEAMTEAVDKMNDYEGIMDLIEWLEKKNVQNVSHLINGGDLICSNLEDLDMYNAQFEEGIGPIWASCYVEPVFGVGQVSVLPSRPSDGPMSRLVMVTVSKDDAAKLCEDDVVLQFSPTIVMGVS